MVLLAAETGLRWGELVALRPHHLDPRTATLTVEDVYVEVSKKNSPTGQPDDPAALPQRQRTPHPAHHRQLAAALAGPDQDPAASDRTSCCSPTRPASPSPAPPSAPASGYPPSKPPASTSTCAGTTYATPTPPGSSPAAPTSKPSWTASATPSSPPPSNTSTPCPTPTTPPSPHSPASADAKRSTADPRRHQPDKPPLLGARPIGNDLIWLPSVSRRSWEGGSRLVVGGSGK